MSPIPDEIQSHYLESNEADRLKSPLGELEFLRTQSILARKLPPPPGVILDVGGAAGVYAIPLAKQGYEVHLIDPVDLHLQRAAAYAASSHVELASVARGDARRLELAAGSADSVLLLGPLYHLVDSAGRLSALGEARRVLKPDGLLIAAAISRFASLIAGLAFDTFADPDFRDIVAADLRSGQHRNPTDKLSYFTAAFFHRPAELAEEMRGAGFENIEILAVEGPLWSAAHFQRAWTDPIERELLLEFLASVEHEPSLLGASAHFLAIAHAP